MNAWISRLERRNGWTQESKVERQALDKGQRFQNIEAIYQIKTATNWRESAGIILPVCYQHVKSAWNLLVDPPSFQLKDF